MFFRIIFFGGIRSPWEGFHHSPPSPAGIGNAARLDEITVDPGLVPLAFAADALKHGAQILEECQVKTGLLDVGGECDQLFFFGEKMRVAFR